MLTKLATFRGVSEQGEPLIHLFDPGVSMVKQAGEMMPVIRNWLDAYQPDPNKIAVLVNALGASEYWGQNVNGDIFPESALVHDCANHPGQQHPYDDFTGKVIPSYGAHTFMQAHPFVHHKNKDPNRAFGKVVLWAWNPRMHRVELIILLDKNLALQHGAQHVIDRILAGEFPDVSMGCKVPYDICTICGHKSKTRKDYCNCIRYIGMGKILDDGRKIGVVNTYPRFFDISFVLIGADKTAKVMCKLGSSELWVPQSVLDAEELYGMSEDDDGQLVKAASVQVPANLYSADLEKTASAGGDAAKGGLAGGVGGALGVGAMDLLLHRGRPSPGMLRRMGRAFGEWGVAGGATSGVLSSLAKKRQAAQPIARPVAKVASMSRGEIMDFYIKRAERLMTSRTDTQENYERRALADGTLKTNADVNETDEFPEPLTPSRGKTASVLKQFIKESREKTAIDYGKALQWADRNATRTMRSPVGRSLIGAGVGGVTGAGLAEDRVKGGLLGAGLGAAGALGLSEVTKRMGRRAGSMFLGPEVKKHRAAVDEIKAEWMANKAKSQKLRDEMMKIRDQGKQLTPEQIAYYQKHAPAHVEIAAGLEAENAHFTNLLNKADRSHKMLQDAAQVTSGGVGALVGGFAGGGLGAAAFKEKAAADGMSGLWEKCKKIKIGPPPKPNRKEYPFTGTIDFKGLMIHVENKPGTYREGKGWRTLMKMPYGEFLGTKGVDKDKLDVYVGPYRNAPNVHIIHQNKVRGPQEGKYDEDKVMLGFESLEQAKAAYLAHYDSDKYYRSATVMAFPLFKRAIVRKEVHGEKIASVEQSEYVSIMEKRAEDLRLEDLFSGAETASRRSKVWRHSDGRELKRNGSGMDNWDQVKLASVTKYAAPGPQALLKISAEKWADIVKHIGPDKAVGKVSPLLSESEPSLPKDTLDAMAGQGMEKALATPSMMGMVLKPEEFQRICLKCMGKDDLADKLDDAGAVFKPSEGEMAPCHELSSDQLSPELMKMLMPLMGEKSYLGPVVRRRIIRITIMKPEPLTKSTEVNSPLLSKVASAYNWYRREQMKLAADTMEVVPNNPELHSGLYGIGDEDLFGKTAMAPGVDGNTIAVVLGSIPISLMYSAHLRGERRKGKELGTLKNLVADHPWLVTAGAAAGLRELMKSPQAKQLVSELTGAAKRIIKGAPVPVAG